MTLYMPACLPAYLPAYIHTVYSLQGVIVLKLLRHSLLADMGR